MMRRVCTAILASLLLAGCYDRFGTPTLQTDAEMSANTTLAELRSLWFGEPASIHEQRIVSGIVTSSDRARNFYQTFTICDDTGGAEVLAGIPYCYTIYPVGCRIAVRLEGCAIDCRNGVLQIGLSAEGADNDDQIYGSLGYFMSRAMLDSHIVRAAEISAFDIPTLTCNELTDTMCGCPVRVEHLHFAPDDDSAEAIWDGYARFEDADGNTLYTETSSYAEFAGNPIPQGEVSLTGILQFGSVTGLKEKYFILKMSSDEDCRPHN